MYKRIEGDPTLKVPLKCHKYPVGLKFKCGPDTTKSGLIGTIITPIDDWPEVYEVKIEAHWGTTTMHSSHFKTGFKP